MRHMFWIIPFAVTGAFMTLHAEETPSKPEEPKTEAVAPLPEGDVFTRRRHLETRIKKAETFLNAVLNEDELAAKKKTDLQYQQHEKDAQSKEQQDIKNSLARSKRAVPSEKLVLEQAEGTVTRLTARQEALLGMMSKRHREVFDKAEKALGPSEFEQFMTATKGLNMAESELFLDKIIAAKANPSAAAESTEPAKEPVLP